MLYSALASEPDWEFRIATLQPGGFKDQIKMSLHQVRFKDKPEYEALSYVWGKPKVTESISLNGQPFNITTNLFLALRRLRHEDKPRLLWIDAICIDQSNTQERQQQVSRMKEIYSCASKVTVWMGE
ncbi:heterokaryon incompatibility protein-domain-containing protein, partial [Leptodontidium sp. 2 PMI_412]